MKKDGVKDINGTRRVGSEETVTNLCRSGVDGVPNPGTVKEVTLTRRTSTTEFNLFSYVIKPHRRQV